MDKLMQAAIKAIMFSIMLAGGVVAGSGLISFLTGFIDSEIGFIFVGGLLTLPGTLILGFERMNRVEIKGVRFVKNGDKNDEK